MRTLSIFLLSASLVAALAAPAQALARSPFGPLPPPICGDPWTTPGLGFLWDNYPIRVCIL